MADLYDVIHDPLNASDEDIASLLVADNESDDEQEVDGGASSGAESNDDPNTEEGDQKPDTEGKRTDPNADLEVELTADNARVLTKDGKNEIPFATFDKMRQNEREARQRAEDAQRRVAELEGANTVTKVQLDDLTAKLAELQGKAAEQLGGDIETAGNGDLSDEDLELLAEESPQLAAHVKASQAKMRALEVQLKEEKEAREQRDLELKNRSESAAQSAIDEAISNNPKVLYLRTASDDLFNQFVDVDDLVRGQAKFKSASIADRLEQSVKVYESIHGPIEFPGAKAEDKTIKTGGNDKDKGGKDPADSHPSTLSDMPGGALPSLTASERLAEMSAESLNDYFSGLDDDKMQEALARLDLLENS